MSVKLCVKLRISLQSSKSRCRSPLLLKFTRHHRWWRRRLKSYDAVWDDAVPLDIYFCLLHICLLNSVVNSVFQYSQHSKDVEILFFLKFNRQYRWWRRGLKNDAVWEDAVSFRYIVLLNRIFPCLPLYFITVITVKMSSSSSPYSISSDNADGEEEG